MLRLIVLLNILYLTTISCKKEHIVYPHAHRNNNIADTLHGNIIKDPYRWMEEMDSDKTKAFALAQDSLLEKVINNDPLYDQIKDDIAQITSHDRYYFRNSFVMPKARNGQYFFTKILPKENKNRIYVRDQIDGKDKLLLGPDFESSELELNGFHINKTATTIAYGIGTSSSEWVELRVAPLSNPMKVTERLSGFYMATNLLWSDNEKGFFYTRFNIKEYQNNGRLGFPCLFYHKLGTPQSSDILLYKKKAGSSSLNVKLSTNRKFLLLDVNKTIYIKSALDHNANFQPFLPEQDSTHLNFIANEGDDFFFQTNYEAPKGKVVKINIDHRERQHWQTIIPETDLALGGIIYNNGKLIARYTQDIINIMKIFETSGSFITDVEMPFLGSSYSFAPSAQGTNTVFYSLTNLFNPQSILQLDITNGKSEYFLRPAQNYEPDEFIMEQVFYRSKDGTQIPALLSYKKGLLKDEENPAMIYGYGALGVPTVTFFQPDVVEWLRMGGIYLNTGIRGGGEYGTKWADAGKKMNKYVGINDYLAAGDWLVDKGYSIPSKLVVTGGSLSGLLPAVAITKRPNYYGAAVIKVPVLDFIRFAQYDNSRSWQKEFGDPQIEEEFDALFEYSPYHNITENTDYPPTLIQCGEMDQIAPAFHAFKFAAALQHAQTSNHSILLKTAWGAGHYSAGVSVDDQNETRAQIMTFLAKTLSLNLKN